MKKYVKPEIRVNYFETSDVIATSLTSCPKELSLCQNTNLFSAICNDGRPNVIYFHACFLDCDGDGVLCEDDNDIYTPIRDNYTWERVGHTEEKGCLLEGVGQDIYKGTKKSK